MELQYLRYFQVTAKYEHITRASKVLHIAQPALTRAINKLEDELGLELFEKKGRGIVITKAGIALSQKLSVIFREIDSLPNQLKQIADESYKQIKIHLSVATTMITDAIIEYKKLNCDVVFEITRSDDYADCDISISGQTMTEKIPDNSFSILEQIMVAVSKDNGLSKTSKLSLKTFKHCNFLGMNKTMPLSTMCLNFCKTAGFTPNLCFESDNPHSVRELVSADLGVAFWPKLSWNKMLNDNIKLIEITEPKCFRKIIVTRHSDPIYTEHTKFLNYLKEKFKS